MIAVLSVVFLIIVAGVGSAMMIQVYNNLVRLEGEIDRSWANIDVILKQRFDEIPQLVSVVKQYANYEQTSLQKLIEARQGYGSAESTKEKVQAANELNIAFMKVFALSEDYPELRSSELFLKLQSRISELEDQISDRREHFNESVTNYNVRLQQFPDFLIAGSLNYQPHEHFRIDPSEREIPGVDMKLIS